MKTCLCALALALAASLLLVPPQSRAQDVTYDQLLHADKTPQNWLMYGGDYSSQRFSRLTQINTQNVHTLRAAWI